MQRDLLVLRLDQMEDDVTSILIKSLAIAEPLAAIDALDDSVRVVDPAVSASMGWQVLHIIGLHRLRGLCGGTGGKRATDFSLISTSH